MPILSRTNHSNEQEAAIKDPYKGKENKNKETVQEILTDPKSLWKVRDMNLQDMYESLFHLEHSQTHILALVSCLCQA